MPALRDIQSAIRRALLDGDGAEIAPLILEDGIFADERLAVYRSNLVGTITTALREVYPVIERLVGTQFFDHAAHEFLCAHPPERANLNAYGGAFADFLAGFQPARGLVYLADTARLEWRLHVAAMAPVPASLAPGALAGVDAADMPRLVFHVQPALGYLESPWPIDRIWRVNQPGGADHVVDLESGGVGLEVGRDGDKVRFRPLAPGVFAFRAALAAGSALDMATEAALAREEKFDLIGAFSDLFREGLLIGFALD